MSYLGNSNSVQILSFPLTVSQGGTGGASAVAAKTSLSIISAVNDGTLIEHGTTAQRGSFTSYKIRYNDDLASWEGANGSAWGSIGGGAKGDVFYENSQIISADYTLGAGRNAMSAGPITISNGVTVTITSGSFWSIVGA